MVKTTLNIALSGLAVNERRIDTAASNIANSTTAGALGSQPGRGAYTPQDVIQETLPNGGVQANTVPRNQPFVPAYDPNSPFANEEGLIAVPNVDLAREAVDIKISSIAFKANLEVIQAASQLSDELLSIFDKEV